MRPALSHYPQSEGWKLWVLVGILAAISLSLDVEQAQLDAARNAVIEYEERGGLTAREYHDATIPEEPYRGAASWDGEKWTVEP